MGDVASREGAHHGRCINMKSPLFERSIKEAYAAPHEPGNLRTISEAFWRGLIVSALIAVLGVVAFGLWEFSVVMKKISTENAGTTPQADVLDKQKLEQVVVEYAGLKAEYEFAKKNRPSVTDPTR